jgi:hypothetical protein
MSGPREVFGRRLRPPGGDLGLYGVVYSLLARELLAAFGVMVRLGPPPVAPLRTLPLHQPVDDTDYAI